MTNSNITVGAIPQTTTTTIKRYVIPLDLSDVKDTVEIVCTIENNVFNLFFNFNEILGSLFLSAYTLNKSQYYFAGFQCVFNSYLNEIDNGCPYLFYFVDRSNGQNYAATSQKITYESLSNGVTLYAELR